jgi:plastocyanin
MSAPRSLVLVSLFALVAGCTSSTAPSTGGGGGGGGTCSGTNAAVAVCDNHFSPSTSTITAGSTITWTWKGSNTHNVTFLTGPVIPPASSSMASGTFPTTFTTPGTYTYECSLHGSVMSGTITVN